MDANLNVSGFLDNIMRILSNVKRKLNENDDDAALDYALSSTERALINLQRIRPLVVESVSHASDVDVSEFDSLTQEVNVSSIDQ